MFILAAHDDPQAAQGRPARRAHPNTSGGPAMPDSLIPFPIFGFRARSPVRDFLRNLRRWLRYRPERSYMRGR